MSLTNFLAEALANGVDQVGLIQIRTNPYRLHHIEDHDLSELEIFTDPEAAREIGLYSPEGEYRFTKAENSLRKGWLLELKSLEEVRQALDLFHPAALGLWRAKNLGTLQIQDLREKLSRQTGMYRHSSKISDQGAQKLVQSVCGPANKCVKKILWKISPELPLEESEASRFDGIPGEGSIDTSIPLLCQEACNYFVSQARVKAKEEFEKSGK